LDCEYVRPSCPFMGDNKWYMLYWGFDGVVNSIGCAESFDLIHWTKCGVLLRGTNEHDGITGSQVVNGRVYYATFDNGM